MTRRRLAAVLAGGACVATSIASAHGDHDATILPGWTLDAWVTRASIDVTLSAIPLNCSVAWRIAEMSPSSRAARWSSCEPSSGRRFRNRASSS